MVYHINGDFFKIDVHITFGAVGDVWVHHQFGTGHPEVRCRLYGRSASYSNVINLQLAGLSAYCQSFKVSSTLNLFSFQQSCGGEVGWCSQLNLQPACAGLRSRLRMPAGHPRPATNSFQNCWWECKVSQRWNYLCEVWRLRVPQTEAEFTPSSIAEACLSNSIEVTALRYGVNKVTAQWTIFATLMLQEWVCFPLIECAAFFRSLLLIRFSRR